MNYLYFLYTQFLTNHNIPVILGDITFAILPFVIVIAVLMLMVLFLVYAERKILALFTQRFGPNRVGYKGILQTTADALKLLCKQNVTPVGADKLLFNLAPILVFVPVIILWGLIPYSSEFIFMNFSVSLLLYFAVAVLPVLGIVLAGYASNNKYSYIGAIRSCAQIISYELPISFVMLSIVTLSSSLNLKDIIYSQISDSAILGWYIFPCILGFCIMFVAVLAELNRCPFDLPEAESELVAGYNTEYSGMRFAFFFLAEYALLFIMSAFMVCIFFGGFLPIGQKYISEMFFANNEYLQTFIYFEQAIWLFIKSFILVLLIMLVRATLPRMASKSLLKFSWYFLLPLSIINFFLIVIFKYFLGGV